MIFLTGATSPTGKRLLARLLEMKKKVTCLVREPGKTGLPEGARIVEGALEDLPGNKNYLEGVTAVLNVAHIRFARILVGLCEEIGIDRAIFLSSTRRYSELPDPTVREVIDSERLICASSLKYSIIRPTMIFSDEGDNNLSKIVTYLQRKNTFPIFGSGKNLVQPVFSRDVVEAIIAALERDAAMRKEYTICGPEPMTYRVMVEIIAEEMGKKVRFIHIPMGVSAGVAAFVEALGMNVPLKALQIRRFAENRAFDFSPAQKESIFFRLAFGRRYVLNCGEEREKKDFFIKSWVRDAGHTKIPNELYSMDT